MTRSVFALCVVLCGLLLATGCDDPKQRIALLEDDNQRLIEELGQARNDCDACRGNLQMCEQELATAQADASTLRGQLAGLRDQLAAQPDVPEGWQAVPGGAMIALEGKVLFDFAKTELRSEARAGLDAIARTITTEYRNSDILVYGHTDDVKIGPSKNKWKDNLELSAQRALSVVRYLQSRELTRPGWWLPVVANTGRSCPTAQPQTATRTAASKSTPWTPWCRAPAVSTAHRNT